MNIGSNVYIKKTSTFGKIIGVIYDNGKTTLIVREKHTNIEYECKYKDVMSKSTYLHLVERGVLSEESKEI